MRIFLQVRGMALQIGTESAGIGIAHTAMQTLAFSRFIQAEDTIGIGMVMGQREWPFNRARAQVPVAGQPWKPQ